MNPLVSIVIVNYATPRLVTACIKGLFTHMPRCPLQVIVVDNASPKDDVEIIKNEFPYLFLVENKKNRGFAAGVNAGLRHAEGEYILILNPDIVFRGGEIDALVEWMNAHPMVAIAGPRLLNPDHSRQMSCRRFLSVWQMMWSRRVAGKNSSYAKKISDILLMTDFNGEKDKKVDWLLGAALMVRQSTLAKIGGMDERFFLYFEDVDWCRRAHTMGFEVWYTPVASLIHLHAEESAQLPWWKWFLYPSARHHIASGIRYAWKWRKIPLPHNI